MKKVGRKESGVTNVISSIMLLAITLSVVGTIMEVYLPAWGKDVEGRHQEETITQMYNIRALLEEQSILGVEGAISSAVFSMGTPGGALFGTGRVWGSLEVNTAKGAVNVTDESGETVYGMGNGWLLYKADNGYTSDYSLLCQQGAVVLLQGPDVVLKAPLQLYLKEAPAEGAGVERSIVFNIISLDGESSSYGSSSNALVEMRSTSTFHSKYDFSTPQTVKVNVNIPEGYGGEVARQLTEEFIGMGLTSDDFNITVNPPDSSDQELLEITINNVDHLTLNVLTVEVRVYV